MNGLFGNYWSMPATPRQNVADYLRMPVINAPQQTKYPSIGDIVQMAYPQQEDTFTNNPAIRHIAGLPPIEPQANQQISQSERALLHIAGLNPNQK